MFPDPAGGGSEPQNPFEGPSLPPSPAPAPAPRSPPSSTPPMGWTSPASPPRPASGPSSWGSCGTRPTRFGTPRACRVRGHMLTHLLAHWAAGCGQPGGRAGRAPACYWAQLPLIWVPLGACVARALLGRLNVGWCVPAHHIAYVRQQGQPLTTALWPHAPLKAWPPKSFAGCRRGRNQTEPNDF